MRDQIKMIPSNANPYVHDHSMREPVRLIRDPGVLTISDLDRLVAARVEDARKEWLDEKQRACLVAWEEGRSYGREDARGRAVADCASAVTQVIRGRLNHSVRKLRDRMGHQKTTIKDERLFCEMVANEVAAAIATLATIEGVEP